jgi:phosphoserine phosphatase
MTSGTAYCFDLDGTVTIEEIIPQIAKMAGLFEEMQVLTAATLKGILPFENSFRLRCKLLGDVPISTVHKVMATISMDSDIRDFIVTHHSQCFVLTGNLDVWVRPLLDDLGCKAYTSHAKCENDRLGALTHVLYKGDAVSEVRLNFERVIAIGDSINDISMLESADIGIVYCGVHEPVPELIDASLYVVTNGKGLCRLLNTL